MLRKPLSTEFLRPENNILLADPITLQHDLRKVLADAGIMVANITSDFLHGYVNLWTREKAPEGLNVSTVRQQIPDMWLAALRRWGGISFCGLLSAVAIQGSGQDGDLLTNGKLNGCVLAENPDYAATFRWHDPQRPYEGQTAQYPNLGWSFHVVRTFTRRWCPQGGKIIYV